MHEREETGREMSLIPALKRQKRAEVEASQGYTERPASKRKETEIKIMHSKFGVKPRQSLARLTLLQCGFLPELFLMEACFVGQYSHHQPPALWMTCHPGRQLIQQCPRPFNLPTHRPQTELSWIPSRASRCEIVPNVLAPTG